MKLSVILRNCQPVSVTCLAWDVSECNILIFVLFVSISPQPLKISNKFSSLSNLIGSLFLSIIFSFNYLFVCNPLTTIVFIFTFLCVIIKKIHYHYWQAQPMPNPKLALLSELWESTLHLRHSPRIVDLRPYRAIADSVGIVEHSRL